MSLRGLAPALLGFRFDQTLLALRLTAPPEVFGRTVVSLWPAAPPGVVYEPITITISGGLNSGIDPRRLFRDGNIASTDTLRYNLFLDAGRTTIWGDGTTGQVHTNPRPPRNRNIDVPVFGRVFGGQDPRVGSYSNSLVVTINF